MLEHTLPLNCKETELLCDVITYCYFIHLFSDCLWLLISFKHYVAIATATGRVPFSQFSQYHFMKQPGVG